MPRRKFTNTETMFTSMSLEVQLKNVESCIQKQEEGSAGLRYLLSERDIILAKLEALR